MTAKEAVGELRLYQLVQIVREYEEFEKTGVTGDTLLRRTTEKFTGTSNPSIALNMVGTALEAYKLLAVPEIKRYDRSVKFRMKLQVEQEASHG
jgi:hypothetical protein